MVTYHRPPATDVHRGPRQIYHVSTKGLTAEEEASLAVGTAVRLYVGVVGAKGKVLWESSV
jgi:hypothetical protein